MPYLIGKHAALYHIPKCGGLWARAACLAAGLRWTRVDGCQHSDVMVDRPHRICFTRKPAPWLQSFWAFHTATKWEQYTDSAGFIFYACYRPGEDFSTFVDRYLDRMPGAIQRMFERYKQRCTFVGRVENLRQDLTRALVDSCEAFDPKPIYELPPLNVSPTKPEYGEGQRAAIDACS